MYSRMDDQGKEERKKRDEMRGRIIYVTLAFGRIIKEREYGMGKSKRNESAIEHKKNGGLEISSMK